MTEEIPNVEDEAMQGKPIRLALSGATSLKIVGMN